MKTPILVTGGAGYIGAHTCKHLAAAGFLPIVYDNLSTGHAEFVRWGPLVAGDLHDTQRLSATLEHYRPAAVIHFAASAYVGESMADPLKYYQNNVGGTLSLLEAMRRHAVRHLVFSSTCATYGAVDSSLIDEATPQLPINPYGRSKLMIEQILNDLSTKGELNSVCLRYFNAAGADADCEIGEWHEPETHLIPLAIASASGGKQLQVFGTDFPTADGTAVRDYIHVSDLASGHVKALAHLLAGKGSEKLNLGTGKGASVREVIAALNQVGVDVKYSLAPRREGDPAFLVADNRKAMRVLGWAPAYTNLEALLETAVRWHRQQSTDATG